MDAIVATPNHFAVPTAQDKSQLIKDLRNKYHDGKGYNDLLSHVKNNLQALATHRNCFSREVLSRFFHIEVPTSMQEAIVILAIKRNDLSGPEGVTSEHVKDVINDLVLNEVDDSGGRRYDTTNDAKKDNYKHQLIAIVEYSLCDDLTNHITAGIDRLNRDPLPHQVKSDPDAQDLSKLKKEEGSAYDFSPSIFPPIVKTERIDRNGNNISAELNQLLETIRNSVRKSIQIEENGKAIDKHIEHPDIKSHRAKVLLEIVDEHNEMSLKAKNALKQTLKYIDAEWVQPNEKSLKRVKVTDLAFHEMIGTIVAGPCLQVATSTISRIGENIAHKLKESS